MRCRLGYPRGNDQQTHRTRTYRIADPADQARAEGTQSEIGQGDLVSAAVEANVRWSMRQLSVLPAGARALREGRVTLMGGVYELSTGHVRFI